MKSSILKTVPVRTVVFRVVVLGTVDNLKFVVPDNGVIKPADARRATLMLENI